MADKLGFFYSQFFVKPPYPTTSYEGKTVIVTGSNVGLGKEAARHFARLGASKVILAVRNVDKGKDAQQDIVNSVARAQKEDVVDVWPLDMSSYESVEKFAKRVDAELDRVDVFLANAGITATKYELAEDNEASITVNVVSTFLLAALVLPKMKATASHFGTRPTLVITSSEVHAWATFPQKNAPDGGIFSAVNDNKPDTPGNVWSEQYPISKLLEVFAVRNIAEKHPSPPYPVTINCVNPGLCHSELARDMGWGFWFFKQVVARTTEVGSRTLVSAAEGGVKTHGQYLSDCKVTPPAKLVTSEEGKKLQIRIGEELDKKLNAIVPGVTGNF